jgi:chromosome segregation ATPase
MSVSPKEMEALMASLRAEVDRQSAELATVRSALASAEREAASARGELYAAVRAALSLREELATVRRAADGMRARWQALLRARSGYAPSTRRQEAVAASLPPGWVLEGFVGELGHWSAWRDDWQKQFLAVTPEELREQCEGFNAYLAWSGTRLPDGRDA